jgi:hypothetical protein
VIDLLTRFFTIYLHSKQEWRPRWGYQKANNDMDDWVVEDNKGKSLSSKHQSE